ncbi:MAG: ABC transporter ATP-binding protein [Ignavibacteria bacterium]|nr:ABC transporter ATP-binding protein [Ignavibacteria bacterium]
MKLTITGLSRTYQNGVKALDGVNLEIGEGMFGLLGPNGAGKSTLMRTIASIQAPDHGKIMLDDIDVINDPMSLRKVLGYLPQEFGVYPKISASHLLEYFAALKGISRAAERSKAVKSALEAVNLFDERNQYVAGFSGGMKRRFGIAQLLLGKPKLIIVDEPTAGLDPSERNRFLNVLREIASSNIIIFSTHIVEDIKDLCSDMAIISGGRILRQSAPLKAAEEMEGKIWQRTLERAMLEDAERRYFVLSSRYESDGQVIIRIYSEARLGDGFSPSQPGLEDVYFYELEKGSNLNKAG